MSTRTVLVGVAGLLLLGSVGSGCCKKKPGDSCTGPDPSCVDDTHELICEKGTFVSAPCKGPKGCSIKDNMLTCDISGNAAGDVCGTSNEGQTACSVDNKSQVSCKGGKYAVTPCRGPKGCKTEGTTSICDMSISEEGEACAGPGSVNSYACSVDGKRVLKCKDGKFQLSSYCRGKKCEVKGEKVGCPDPVALAGDPCELTSSGSYACAVDRKSLLVCRGGKWKVDEKCRRGRSCKEKGTQVGCL